MIQRTCTTQARGSRVAAAVIALSITAACGSDNSGSITAPGNALVSGPSGVALIAGSWTGTSDFQQRGERAISNVSMRVTQSDRRVEGTFTFTSPEFTGWGGSFTGQLAGTASDTQFVGNITLTTPTATGTGNCVGQTVMAGRSLASVMRWEAPSMNIAPNGSAPPDACRGQILTLVWIFGR
jgi:hypothetical protein